MSKKEIMVTRYNEMSDMISCYAIFNGGAEQKKKLPFDDALKLR
jgi:hypothetical protein